MLTQNDRSDFDGNFHIFYWQKKCDESSRKKEMCTFPLKRLDKKSDRRSNFLIYVRYYLFSSTVVYEHQLI